MAKELEDVNRQVIKQKDDIQKQSEKLRKAYDEIKKLDNFKHQMTRMIIHDLKNPLNVILNITDTMEIPEKPASMIRQISFEMLDLVLNILDVNKFEESRMQIRYENIDLAAIANKLINKFSFLSRNSSIELKNLVPEPCMISADLQIIERVMENLLSNSVKFTPPGGKIEIWAMGQNEKVRIEVRDNGSGVPGKLVNEVFDEYVQASDKSFIYTNSTGIGLTYCKLAVEAQGGEIGLISKQGEGTTVWFLVNKGTPIPGYVPHYNEEIYSSEPVIPKLSAEEIVRIQHILTKLKVTGIHEVSEIIAILADEVFDTVALKKWRDAVEAAVFSANEKQFRKLVNS
jgi:signal transduction histidine kinase